MHLFRAIVFAAAVAGGIAGLFVTAAHQLGTVPLILKAEVYEEAAATAEGSAAHQHAGHEHGDEGWKPRDGLERTAFTVLADVLTGIGFALLLVAGFALTGRAVGWREGLLWGLAGFVAFTLAPSLGLSPEPPGIPAAPLTPRQLWWALTAASTAAGLALLAFRRTPVAAVAAVVLLALPHFIGAPPPPEAATLVPPRSSTIRRDGAAD